MENNFFLKSRLFSSSRREAEVIANDQQEQGRNELERGSQRQQNPLQIVKIFIKFVTPKSFKYSMIKINSIAKQYLSLV